MSETKKEVKIIRKYPDPILLKKAREVVEITQEIKNLAEEMIEVMGKEDGVGLAAPQIGESKRIIVVRIDDDSLVFINPVILNQSREEKTEEEGCLSFPELNLKIRRPKKIKVEALSEKGEKSVIEARDLLARVLQHEIDHLNGILFIKRAAIREKIKARKALRILRKEYESGR
ncbi:MAG: peptide deformylase [bacterium]